MTFVLQVAPAARSVGRVRCAYLAGPSLAMPLIAISFLAPAAAQVHPLLPAVTVTANRYEQDLQSLPGAVSVITGAQILASGASDANDAIRKLLGVPFRTDLRGGRDYALDLRGFGATAEQNLVVVIDGIRVSENELASARLSAIAPEMIETIEVLRGAAGVQWGEGASAGVIHVVLKKSSAPGFGGSVTGQVESRGGRDVRADLRLNAGGARFDTTLRRTEGDGYRGNSHARQDTASVGAQVQRGDVTARLRVNTETQSNRFPGSLSFAQFAANPRASFTPQDFGDFSETRVTGGVAWIVGNWSLDTDFGKRERDLTGFFTGFNSAATSSSTQWSPKVTYRSMGGTGAGALTLVGGLDAIRWDYGSTSNFGQNEKATQANDAVYLRADWQNAGGQRWVVGARSERINKRADDPVNFVAYERKDTLNAWDLGFSQSLGPLLGGTPAQQWSAYVRAAKAYRLPNVDENRYLFAALRPQITRDVELGLKWIGPDAMQGNLRAFRQSATDEIAYDPVSFSNTNLDPTRRQGIELEGRMPLGAQWLLNGSLQSLSARFTGGPNSGREMPLVSRLSGVVRLAWTIDAQQSLDMGWQHLGDARFGDDNDNRCPRRIPASSLLDARYRWRHDGLELALNVVNLADARGYSQAFSCNTGALYPDAGRTFKISAKYVF